MDALSALLRPQKKKNRAKKTKKPDTRPARLRYWMESHLEKNKVRNLVRCNGMTVEEARVYWRRVRTKRMR